ncbi:unnamed protein product [Protopolystoma xenopodis]|uniref:Uncharacterized protein n=1 Tax=Protopolystoma xenopodis TaxID=117903 RepID=A0A3S5A8W2_9PLAT|nr:unnamed protein product [Protopolystoma xenopodis]
MDRVRHDRESPFPKTGVLKWLTKNDDLSPAAGDHLANLFCPRRSRPLIGPGMLLTCSHAEVTIFLISRMKS